MSHTPKIDRIEDDGTRTPMTLRKAEEWDLLCRENDRLHEHLAWIGRQFCDRTKDADVRVCPQSGDCLTEWCLSCYAWAVICGDRCDECGQEPDGCYCAEDAETKETT